MFSTSDKLTILGGVLAISATIGGSWLSLRDSVQRHEHEIKTIGETCEDIKHELRVFREEWKPARP